MSEMTLDDKEWADHIAMLKTSKSALAGSCSCPWPNHVFEFSGQMPDNRIPDGWPCRCGQTVARWKQCNLGHEHLVSEPKQ